jgi:hypothetical protein
MSEAREGSCVLYPCDKAKQGSVVINGRKYYVSVLSTGVERPSHKVILEDSVERNTFYGTALFKNDPGRKSIISGRMEKPIDCWVDIYFNNSNDPGGAPYLTLKFKPKEPKPAEPAPQYAVTMEEAEKQAEQVFGRQAEPESQSNDLNLDNLI